MEPTQKVCHICNSKMHLEGDLWVCDDHWRLWVTSNA